MGRSARVARRLPSGIRGRLFLLIVLALLPVLLLQGWIYFQRYTTGRSQALQTELEAAEGMATTFSAYADIDQMLKEAVEKSRSLSHELSPAVLHLDDFAETLRWLADEVRRKHGLVVHVQGQMLLESDGLKVFLYKAAQELLFNVVKHARIEIVGEAANGREAVNLADRLEPDVVIMDVSMPLMDGYEATRQIKASLPQVRIVALSMYNECEAMENMQRAGAQVQARAHIPHPTAPRGPCRPARAA